MASYLIDTTILIDLLRGHAPALNWINQFTFNQRFISFVTVAELLLGVRNKQEQQLVLRELAGYQVLYLSSAGQQWSIDVFGQLRLSAGIGFLDCLIAACAYEHSLTLATLNVKHFRVISEIKLAKPY
ncbi:MAG: type II toxin-antitoxin system VapC family toxin [Anaerolineae bacterium]|nr:type II toxin-antitoxin system VapC family toxin [Anaerolineae bacterium]